MKKSIWSPHDLAKRVAVSVIVFLPGFIQAAPVSADQAGRAVQNWVSRGPKPLDAAIGQTVVETVTYTEAAGDALFHVVYLTEGGFVVTSADTEIEPVIAFSSAETLEFVPENPLYSMLTQDLAARKQALAAQQQGGGFVAFGMGLADEASPEAQWTDLLEDNQGFKLFASVTSVSDVRVAPLVQTKWDQGSVGGNAVYNYYTPSPSGTSNDGNANNCVCGCVATAMAQLMKFHGYPTAYISPQTFSCKVGGATKSLTMKGGTYAWASMPDVPGSSSTVAQRQAIGKICYDAGVSVRMAYTQNSSGAMSVYVPDSLKNVFGYASAAYVYNYNNNANHGMTENEITKCILSNLDNGYPVYLGITGSSGGHAIFADGYGFNNGIRYVHLNMGWSGSADVWYTLPNMGQAGSYTFTILDEICYNIFPDSEKKLVSGRVLDASGTPVPGASVEVRNSSGTLLTTLTTNAKGMYACARSGTTASETLKLRASSGGLTSTDKTVTLLRSTASTIGNVWGEDLTLNPAAGSYSVTLTANPVAGGSVSGGGVKSSGSSCTVTATPNNGYSFVNWTEGSTVLSTSASHTFTVTANRTLTANFAAGSIPLATALDTSTLTWTTSGSASWYGQVTTTHDGVDAARSGTIGHSQQSVLQTTLTGPGTLSFWWNVSSESGYDFLTFYANGTEQTKISGAPGWAQKTYTIPSGTYTLQWVYQKDSSVNSGSDCGWVDQVVWTPSTASYTVSTVSSPSAGGSTSGGGSKVSGSSCTVTATPASGYAFVNWKVNGSVVSTSASYAFTVTGDRALTASFVPTTISLATALDNTSLAFSASGSGAAWFGQATTRHDGVDAAQSGPIGHSQSSILQTTVTGPGTFSFWWRVSSEANYDFLKFYANGTEQASISGEPGWAQKAYAIPSGTYTLQWAYQKDASVNSGSDCGWVDQMVWTPSVTYYTVSASASPAAGGSVSGGGSIPVGTSCTLTATPATGYAFVNWKEGSTVVSTSASYTFAVTGNRTLTANFVQTYTVAATAVPANGGTVAGAGVKTSGSSCTLTATPAAGYAFTNWKEGSTVVSTSAAYTFTVTGNRTLTANFTASNISLSTALDGSGLTWTTSGNANWYGQAATTHDNVDAAKSGIITHSQSSSLQTTVTGPGTFTFWWAVSSEANYDFLTFYVDDVAQVSISGTTITWAQQSVALGSGTHVLRWTYSKDISVSSGLDAGFVDQAVWTPNTQTYAITLSASPAAGGTVTGGGSKTVGSTCTVTATPASGYAFTSWNEGATVVGTSPSYSFVVNGARTLTAMFKSTASLPDFVVESITFDPTAAAAGGTMTSVITIKNIGAVAGTVGYVDVWLDRTDAPPAGSDGDAWAEVGELAAGATYTLDHTFTVPPGAGTKTYLVFVDSYDETDEGNESNNQLTATYTALTPIPLEVALDNENLVFMTDGTNYWIGQTGTSHDGVDAAQSGGIYDGQTSTLQTVVTGPGTLSFWWKVSSEENFDFLRFSINGSEQAFISGDSDWAQKTYSIAAGQHVLRWVYEKDESYYNGLDCGWVDQVVWTPSSSYTISANASPSAGGAVTGAGSKTYGTTCTLTATPANNYTFVNWTEGSSIVATTPTYAFTVTGARTLTANFTPVVQRPDFIIESISFPSSYVTVGQTLTATVTVKNQGPVSGDGGYLDVWIDRANEAPVGSDGDGWASIGTLAAGASRSFTHTFTASAPVGTKTYRAFADSADITQEGNESNNQRTATYTVTTTGSYIIPFDFDSALTTVGSYNGYIYDGDFDAPNPPEDLFGTLTVKVTKLTGTLTAKAVFMGGSVSFSTKTWSETDPDGTRWAQLTARTGEALVLAIKQQRFIGAITGGKAGSDVLIIDGARDRLADKKDAGAQALLARMKGYYTTVIESPYDDALRPTGFSGMLEAVPMGCGYLTITVGTGGSVKFSGKLADGTSVSASNKLIWYEMDGKLCAPLFIPLYSKKGTLGGLVWFDPDTQWIETVVTWYKRGVNFEMDGFYVATDLWGNYYNKKPQMYQSYGLVSVFNPMAYSYYASGLDVELMSGGSVGYDISVAATGRMTLPKGKAPARYGKGKVDDPYWYGYDERSPMTTLTFTPGTGVFKGTTKAYYDHHYETGKILHKTVSVPYAGVMVQTNGRPLIGAGYNLVPEPHPSLKPYKIKWSGLVFIEAQ